MTKNDSIGQISEQTCESWEDFCRLMRPADGSPIEPIFRGQADLNWPLVPPSAREKYWQVKNLREASRDVTSGGPAWSGQYQHFQHLAKGLPGVDLSSLDEIDIEALARHHGLASNLLDWTSSPYVAAFFAFTSALDRANEGRLSSGTLTQGAILPVVKPVCVWQLGITKDIWIDGEFELLASLSNVNYWQKAQRGCFTRLTHKDYLDVESYLIERNMSQRLTRYIIPSSEVHKALGDLGRMNINFSTLFPDLWGAAMQANISDYFSFY